MTLRAQAARGLKWQAIEIGGRQVLSLVVFTTLARLLNPADFGLIGLVGVYLAFVGMFVDQGIGTAIIQRKELDPGHLDAAFWFNVVCACLMCGATIVLAGPVARFFHEPTLRPLLQWGSPALVINASAAVHHTLFFREMDFRRPAIRTLVGNLVGGIVGVIMALAGCGVWSLIGQQLAAAFASAVFLWTASSWRPRLTFSLSRLRELMSVSLSVFSVGFLWFFSSRLDQIVIGRFFGAGILGQYVIGAKLPELAKTAVQAPIGAIAMPALSQLQQDHARMRQAIYKGMELNALVSFGVFGGLVAVAPTLVPLVFGEQWLPAVPMLQLLSIYALVLGLFVYCHPALIASGGIGKYVFVNLECTIGAVVVCFVGVHWGAQTIVAGLILNLLLAGAIALLFLRHRIGISLSGYAGPCVVPAIAATAMIVIVYALHGFVGNRLLVWFDLSLQVLAGAAVYSAIVATLAFPSIGRLWDIGLHGFARQIDPT